MSHDRLFLTAESVEEVKVVVDTLPAAVIVAAGHIGPQGPPGEPGQWTALTQAEYDLLDPPDPEMLYVIVP